MRSPDANLMRFVRRVHRRLIVARALERAGACVAVASGFACAFAVAALVQGRDAMPIVLATLAVGAVAGVLWGLAQRPTRFDAVVEADEQLGLHDLLATAYARRAGDDPWQRAVVALADARCRTLAPAAVVVHRYGGRAWGGIGLAAATGLTLALVSGVPRDSRARPADSPHAAAAREAATETREDPARSPSPAAAAARTPARARSAESASPRTFVESQRTSADAAREAEARVSFSPPGGEAGDGGDRPGETAAATGDAVPRPAGEGRNETTTHDPAMDSTAAAGGAGATDAPPAGGPAGSPGSTAGATASNDRRDAQRTPPWASSSWSADRAAAGEAMRSGKIPDAYRDVVGEYFRDDR